MSIAYRNRKKALKQMQKENPQGYRKMMDGFWKKRGRWLEATFDMGTQTGLAISVAGKRKAVRFKKPSSEVTDQERNEAKAMLLEWAEKRGGVSYG